MARIKEYIREDVLDAATQLFWMHGFKGTSMSNLVATTGLNKQSMYQEFGNKEELFRASLDNYVKRSSGKGNDILLQEPLGLSNIEVFFHRHIERASLNECPGCMLVNSAIEKELLEDDVFLQVEKSLLSIEENIFKCLVAAQQGGQLAQDKDCRVLAVFLMTFANGIMVQSKTSRGKEDYVAMLQIALSSLKNG